MTTPLVKFRVYETTLHEKLFTNIKILTHVYPPSKDFNEVFKVDMFKKNNKAAFQQVIYYLFTVLDPELTKEKIKSWPTYDAKGDREFRQEVLSFIDHINEKYESVDIPKLMPSLLVSPGGIKIVKFMLKMSILVTYAHLKRNKEQTDLLAPIRSSKDPAITETIIQQINRTSSIVEKRTFENYNNFHKFHAEALVEANRIVEQQEKIEKELAEVNKAIEEEKKKNIKPVGVENVKDLQQQMTNLENIKRMCERAKELLECVSGGKQVLEFYKENINPDRIKPLIQTDNLNLLQFCNGLNDRLSKEHLRMPAFSKEDLKDMIQFLSGLTEKYKQLNLV
ncbi:uncharacterized protein LOC123007132 [Tribolium madens]|uniref:uncharacterized protein LOC123007132 n=1 Tax=Tribolium madens TaxID=41895 RepID=UPI001CF761C4|nr:uncharacterized protein LOC123007132 [Tribolium madens]